MGYGLDSGGSRRHVCDTAPMKRAFPIFFLLYAVACLYTLYAYSMFASVLARMALCWCAGLLVMVALFFVGRHKKRYDIVDVGWGLSFIAIAVSGFFLQDGHRLRWDPQALATLLVMVWGGRLSWHIWQRFRRSGQEDMRYVELRKKWKGSVATNAFFRIFVVQSLLALLVSIPVIHINLETDVGWSLWIYAGLGLWLVGFACEVVADAQLKHFLMNPKNHGKLMTEGLWKYSRYPNYFGEITMWWAFAVMALGTPHGWVGLGGAAIITYLIVYISGIPPKEVHLKTRDGWQQYVKNTRSLVPLPK